MRNKSRAAITVLLAFVLVFIPVKKNQAAGGEIVYVPQEDLEEEFIELWNQYRLENGKKPIIRHPAADHVGDLRIREAAEAFNHDNLNNYPVNSENLAYGQKTAQAVLKAWKNSPKHNSNLLLDRYWGAHTVRCIRREVRDENDRVLESKIFWLTLSTGNIRHDQEQTKYIEPKLKIIKDPNMPLGERRLIDPGSRSIERCVRPTITTNYNMNKKTLGPKDYTYVIEDEHKHFPISRGSDKVVREGTNRSKANYISKGVNVRNLKGKKLGYLPAGYMVEGRDRGSYVEINYKNQTSRVAKKFLNEYVYGYRSKGVNIRDARGNKLGYLPKGKVIKAKDLGNRLEFIYQGKKAYVSKAYVQDMNYYVYRSKGVNVRDLSNKKLGYLNRNEKVYGRPEGNFVIFNYRNTRAKVHKNFLY